MRDEDPEIDPRRAEAADPATTPERQFELSTQHPDLLPVLATNPALYADLRAWLASLGDPAIDEGLELAAARTAASSRAAGRGPGGGGEVGARPRGTGTAPEGIPLDETATLPRARGPGEPPVRTSVGIRRSTGGGGRLGSVAPASSTVARGREPSIAEPTTVLPAVLPAASEGIERSADVGVNDAPEWTAQDEAAWRRRRRAGCSLAVLAVTLTVVGLLWTTGTVSLAAPAPPPPAPPALAPPAEEASWPHTESPRPTPHAEAASVRTARATSTGS